MKFRACKPGLSTKYVPTDCYEAVPLLQLFFVCASAVSYCYYLFLASPFLYIGKAVLRRCGRFWVTLLNFRILTFETYLDFFDLFVEIPQLLNWNTAVNRLFLLSCQHLS